MCFKLNSNATRYRERHHARITTRSAGFGLRVPPRARRRRGARRLFHMSASPTRRRFPRRRTRWISRNPESASSEVAGARRRVLRASRPSRVPLPRVSRFREEVSRSERRSPNDASSSSSRRRRLFWRLFFFFHLLFCLGGALAGDGESPRRREHRRVEPNPRPETVLAHDGLRFRDRRFTRAP